MVNTKESVRNNFATLLQVYEKDGSLKNVMNEENYTQTLGWKFGNRYNVIGRVLSYINVVGADSLPAKFIEELKILRSAAADKEIKDKSDDWAKVPKTKSLTPKKKGTPKQLEA